MQVISYIGMYIGAINLMGLILMGIDKHRSRRSAWRIPESTLMLIAIFGGSIGSYIGMHIFHHKTLKPKFFIGIPVILLIQALIILYMLFLSPFTFKIM